MKHFQTGNTIDYQPGDGWRYVVAVSPLPHDGFEGGGDTDDYALVAVWVPLAPALPAGPPSRIAPAFGFLPAPVVYPPPVGHPHPRQHHPLVRLR